MQRKHSGSGHRTTRVVSVVVGFAILLAACARPPDETQIREAIAAMQAAAEARNASGVLDHIADDFSGQRGEVDRAALGRIVKIEFLRREGVGVSIGAVDVRIDGDRATTTFAMTLTDRSQRFIPGGGETYDVVSGWRRDGRDWVCYNATWTAQR